MLFFWLERQIAQIDHRGIVESPLQNIVSDEAFRQHWRLICLGDGLPAVGENTCAVLIAELDLAIDQGKRCALRVVHGFDRHDKFGAFDSRGGAVGQDLDAARGSAMEKGKNSFEQLQACLRPARGRRQDFDHRLRVDRHHALIGPPEGDATVGPGAQEVARLQDLICRREHPVRGGRGHELEGALELHDADLLCRRAGFPGLRTRQPGADEQGPANCSRQNMRSGCPQ